MAFIKCPKCGQTALSVATVCPKCGHILLQSPTPQGDSREFGNCRRCGKIIPHNAAVCEFCGYPQLLRRRLRRGAWALAAAAAVIVGIIALLPSVRTARPASPVPPQRAAAAPAPAPDTASETAAAGHATVPPDTVLPTATPIRAAPPTAAPTEVPAPPAVVEAQPRRVTTSTLNRWAVTWANIRSGPGSDYQVVRVLRPGERVQVAEASRGWWTVYQDGVAEGYVANSVLSDHAPPPDSVPQR